MSPVKDSKIRKRSWLKPVLFAHALLALASGFWLYTTLSEVGLTGLLSAFGPPAADPVHLKEQPVYRVKKRQQLLGMNVVRIVSRRQPEEFLVLSGVSDKLVDRFYGKEIDLGTANVTANQFLKLRGNGEDAMPVSVDIQDVKTLNAGKISRAGKELPYWELEIKFKLSNEDYPRTYQAGIVRDADAPAHEEDRETLVVGYAQKDAYEKKLITDLMNQLDLENKG